MLNFIVMTLSFTVAILLASVIACAIVMTKPVMTWYMNKVQKLTMDVFGDLLATSEEEDES